MKKGILFVSSLFFVIICFCQIKPETWRFSVKKINDANYELHLQVIVQSPWHIYSQSTPAGGPNPTIIRFNKSPMVIIDGSLKEIGNLLQKHENVFDVDVKYFNKSVDFVQKVKVKGKAKTNISGTISYMICNDEMCLPPRETKFNLKLE